MFTFHQGVWGFIGIVIRKKNGLAASSENTSTGSKKCLLGYCKGKYYQSLPSMSCNPCGSTPLSLGCGWLKRLHPQRLKIRLPIVPHAWPEASRHLLAVRDLFSKIMYRDTSWAIFKSSHLFRDSKTLFLVFIIINTFSYYIK